MQNGGINAVRDFRRYLWNEAKFSGNYLDSLRGMATTRCGWAHGASSVSCVPQDLSAVRNDLRIFRITWNLLSSSCLHG